MKLGSSRTGTWCLFGFFLTLVTCLNAANAQVVARVELHTLQALTLTDQQVLTGSKDAKPATLAGELRLPPGAGRLPAVILVHGSGGVSGYVDEWAQHFNSIGVATFVLDSFTGRGIVVTVNDQDQLGRLSMTVDTYRALEFLSRHSRIEPTKIMAMGFSRGGQAVLYSTMKRLIRQHGPSNGAEFAGYITMYANCGTTYIDDVEVVDKPIRMFHGRADDYVPVAPCEAYVQRLQSKGKDVQLTVYPDAHHTFDSLLAKTPTKLAQAQTSRKCVLEEAPDGQTVNSVTKKPFTNAGDSCVEKGVTLAYNAEAHAQSLKAVDAFVNATFKR